jgi:hypothetical protein
MLTMGLAQVRWRVSPTVNGAEGCPGVLDREYGMVTNATLMVTKITPAIRRNMLAAKLVSDFI